MYQTSIKVIQDPTDDWWRIVVEYRNTSSGRHGHDWVLSDFWAATYETKDDAERFAVTLQEMVTSMISAGWTPPGVKRVMSPDDMSMVRSEAWNAVPESKLKIQWPDRLRCRTCRRFLGMFYPKWGAYCSYRCAGRPEPSKDPRDWPRSHCTAGYKEKTAYPWPDEESRQIAFANNKDIYFDTYCGLWHLGSRRRS